MEAFPGAFPARSRAHHTGNPVRDDITRAEHPRDRLADRTGKPRLLILGGSQGALRLNQMIPAALAAVTDKLPLDIRHQCGRRHVVAAEQAYQEAGVTAWVLPFIDNMAEAYAWADLVICRAGAMTIAELAAVGAASVLVPFPYAVDDHQTHNAHYLVDAGAAILMPESDLTQQSLTKLLSQLLSDRSRLQTMACAARERARPNAADRVAELCLEVAA
jgi:UDP-N-acetylglucosamine--N-acetylmuramyl-(pentapeptide) pyrophosphoryl-undecaprenol N-acetylglucosamine transferase